MKHSILYTGLLLFSFSFAFSQADSLNIPSEKVEVIKRYEAAILQAKKKKINYSPEEKVTSSITYNYNVTTEKVIDFERPEPEIRALGYKGKPVVQNNLKNGYVYGAYGTHRTMNAGAAYHYFIEDWLEAGFKTDYMSTRDSLDNGTRIFSDLNANAYIGYHLGSQTKIRLTANAERARWDDVSYNLPDLGFLQNPVNRAGVGLDLSHNVFEDKSLALRLSGSYDKVDLGFNVTDKIAQTNFNVIKTISDNVALEVPVEYRNTKGAKSNEDIQFSVSEIVLNPNLRLKSTNYIAKAGLQYIKADDINYFFPIVDVTLLGIIAGMDLRLFTESEYRRNAASNLFMINPYYDYYNMRIHDYSLDYRRSYTLQPEYNWLGIDMRLSLSYNQYTNSPNFLSTMSTPEVEYLDRNEISISPAIDYSPTDNISLGLSARYNVFITDSIDVFYVPRIEVGLSGKQFLFDDKLELTQLITYQGKRQYQNLALEIADLDGFVDFTLRIRYEISPSFDVFVQGANLLGRDYVLWEQQPVLKQQIWGGLKFRI